MQAEIVQWEKSVKAECIFYIDFIRYQKGVSLSKDLTKLIFVRQEGKNYDRGIPKEVAAQSSGCFNTKILF